MATLILGGLLAIKNNGLRPALRTLKTLLSLYNCLSSIGMNRFSRSRDDYVKYRKHAPTIDLYALEAKRTLTMVGVSFPTAIPNHGLRDSLKSLLESANKVVVRISLLDCRNAALMEALAPVMEKSSEELKRDIASSVNGLVAFKKSLSEDARQNLHIYLHGCIPFSSAILIDEEELYGRIQIETKPYKAPLKDSFGFELSSGSTHPLYATLKRSFNRIINDGEEVQSELPHEAGRTGSIPPK